MVGERKLSLGRIVGKKGRKVTKTWKVVNCRFITGDVIENEETDCENDDG